MIASGGISAESGKGDIWIAHRVLVERVAIITGTVRSMTACMQRS